MRQEHFLVAQRAIWNHPLNGHTEPGGDPEFEQGIAVIVEGDGEHKGDMVQGAYKTKVHLERKGRLMTRL